jgi:hypothetical protein
VGPLVLLPKPVRVVSVLCLVALAAVGCKRSPSSGASPGDGPSASAAPFVEPPPPSRCDEPAADATFTLGEDKLLGGPEDDILPFAAEVGDGIAFADGFAVGALAPRQGGVAAVVVTLDAAGKSPRVTSLGLAHGDTPPPRVAALGRDVVAALLESGASGRRLRLAHVEGDAVTWGPTFDQGADESLAFDVALGEPRGVVAWDDDAKDPERGVIRVATFVTKGLGAPTTPRIVTGKKTDAESPRVIARPGGFWLLWIARKPEPTDDDAREVGEATEFRWVEAVPLDANGAPTGSPRRITAADGHVQAYDVIEGGDGSAIVAYRDDDTPSGSAGGVILRVVLRPDGSSDPAVLTDRHIGVGAPALIPGWFAIADATAETRLARIGPAGELLESLDSEPVLGRGEPIAARGDVLLVSRPRGKGVRLSVTRCRPGAPPVASP